jgi:hypothetical protein
MIQVAYVGADNAVLSWTRVARYLGDRVGKVVVNSEMGEQAITDALLTTFRACKYRYGVVHLPYRSPMWNAVEEAVMILTLEGTLEGTEFVPFVQERRDIDTFAQAVPALRRLLTATQGLGLF